MNEACRSVQEWLDLHAKRALDEGDAGAIDRHLRECTDCREAFALEMELLAMADESTTCFIPEGFAADVVDTWSRDGWADRLLRRRRRWETALSQFVFRTLVDPLLQVEYQMHSASILLRFQLVAPLQKVRGRLWGKVESVQRTIASPLRLAYRSATDPLIDGT